MRAFFNLSRDFKGAIFEGKGVLFTNCYPFENSFPEIMNATLSELVFTRSLKIPSKYDDFMLCRLLGNEFSFNCEQLFTNMKVRLHLRRASPIFKKICDNLTFKLGSVEYSSDTRLAH